MNEITDPNLISQLESNSSATGSQLGQAITDPDIISQLEKNSVQNGQKNQQPTMLDKINYAYGLNRTPVDTLRDMAAGAIGTLGKGGQLLASSLTGLTGGYAPTVNFDDITNAIASPHQSLGGNFARGIGSFVPGAIAAGSAIVPNILANSATGFVNASPDQSNFFGLLPQGRPGSALENAILTGAGGYALNKMFPVSVTQGAKVNYSPKFSMPDSDSQFTNVPYSQPSFLSPSISNQSETMANDLHQKFIGEKTPQESAQNVASALNNKYNGLKDYYKYRYANIFNKDSDIDYPQEEGNVQVKDVPLSTRGYADKFEDADFPNDSLQSLHEKFMNSKNIGNSQALQSELGSEIGYLKKQNSNGILDSSGKNLLSQYSDMRSLLKNDMYHSLESIQPGLGNQYNEVTRDWERDVVPFSSDKDLKSIADGRTKNPSSSQVVSIFKNPEENINHISSMLGEDVKNDIVRLGTGKGEFQNTPKDMMAAHNAIYSKGLNNYLDPYDDQQFRNLRDTYNTEQSNIAQQKLNQSTSNQLKEYYKNAVAESQAQSKNALLKYNKAQAEAEKIINANKGLLTPPEKSSFLQKYLNPLLGISLGGLAGHAVDNNSILGSYAGHHIAASLKKGLKKK